MPVGVALLAALALGACQTNDGSHPVARADITTGTKPIAFESIDGPPEAVFDKLVASLGTEANARKIQVVSREGDAAYRVRGYLAASVEGGKGSVDWVWDVFDADHERVLRVAGVEELGKGKDVWSELDDAAVERIASQSLDEISTKLAQGLPPKPAEAVPDAAPEPAEAPAVRMDNGPPIASAEPADGQDGEAGPGTALAEEASAPSQTLSFAARP
ncbi:hypothetical protein [Ancylobacter mangrovi]|uniref:hypothetical protein n=1 Tax=Ancylobacter mangrovi TaxID=2972472 RepID=UPI002161265C|nr:hypothetical protein [Ancylobacter mangrovi]MCS0501473.1 hypothetical protein [Ancylobacter mangrovi]